MIVPLTCSAGSPLVTSARESDLVPLRLRVRFRSPGLTPIEKAVKDRSIEVISSSLFDWGAGLGAWLAPGTPILPNITGWSLVCGDLIPATGSDSSGGGGRKVVVVTAGSETSSVEGGGGGGGKCVGWI